MVALYIILGIILLIALLLSLNVHIKYKLRNKQFSLFLQLGPVRIRLTPKKSKRFNYKKLASRLKNRKISQIAFKEKVKGKSLNVKEIFSDLRLERVIEEISKSSNNPEITKVLLTSAKDFALKFKKGLHTNIKRLIIKVDEGEAADTCIRTGIISQAIAYITEFFNIFTNLTPLTEGSIAVVPCFDNSGYDFYVEGSFRVRILTVITSFFSSVFKSFLSHNNVKISTQSRKDIKK